MAERKETEPSTKGSRFHSANGGSETRWLVQYAPVVGFNRLGQCELGIPCFGSQAFRFYGLSSGLLSVCLQATAAR